jgi:Family of unknown function (DUF6272)
MTADTLLQQYLQSQDKGIALSFKGPLSQENLVALSDALRNSVGFEGKSKKAFGIFIEMTQNVKNYSAETILLPDGQEVGVGMVAVQDEPGLYILSVGNKMFTENVTAMTERCQRIKSMTYEELRAYHRARMREGPPPGSKGAGLGLIDIAMKSDQEVEFTCLPIDEQFSFFTINACVRKGF